MVRHICPKWERVVNFVTREVWGAVVPPGDRGLIVTESLVAMRAHPVEDWWVKNPEAGERLR